MQLSHRGPAKPVSHTQLVPTHVPWSQGQLDPPAPDWPLCPEPEAPAVPADPPVAVPAPPSPPSPPFVSAPWPPSPAMLVLPPVPCLPPLPELTPPPPPLPPVTPPAPSPEAPPVRSSSENPRPSPSRPSKLQGRGAVLQRSTRLPRSVDARKRHSRNERSVVSRSIPARHAAIRPSGAARTLAWKASATTPRPAPSTSACWSCAARASPLFFEDAKLDGASVSGTGIPDTASRDGHCRRAGGHPTGTASRAGTRDATRPKTRARPRGSPEQRAPERTAGSRAGPHDQPGSESEPEDAPGWYVDKEEKAYVDLFGAWGWANDSYLATICVFNTVPPRARGQMGISWSLSRDGGAEFRATSVRR